jgi:hypothetical protein
MIARDGKEGGSDSPRDGKEGGSASPRDGKEGGSASPRDGKEGGSALLQQQHVGRRVAQREDLEHALLLVVDERLARL